MALIISFENSLRFRTGSRGRMPPKTVPSILKKRPPTVLEQLLDPEDDSTLRAAVANKRSRSQRIVGNSGLFHDGYGDTTVAIFNNRSLLKGALFRQHQEQSKFLDYTTGK